METRISFKREGIEGIVPVGSYLSDAAKRLGVRFSDKCDQELKLHFCQLEVPEGAELLSPPTAAESEYFGEKAKGTAGRLACQTKIDKEGEIVVMTPEAEAVDEGPKEKKDRDEDFAKRFSELPLEKKIAQLVNLEAMTLGETVSFVVNSPYMVFDKLMDVMAEFGIRKEQMEKGAARPAEHVRNTRSDDGGREKKAGRKTKRSVKEEM